MVARIELGKTLNLEIDFIPESNSNRPGTRIKPEYITIHNTDNEDPGAGALVHAKYMKGADAQKRKVSWHYTVDDKLCVKHLPLNEMSWHAASAAGNRSSISIEICMNAEIDQSAANRRAATLTAILMYDLSIPINNVVPHHHWSGKNCPRLLLNNGKPGEKWKKFLEQVNLIYQSIEPQEEMVQNIFSEKKDSTKNKLLAEWFDTHGVENVDDSNIEALTDPEFMEESNITNRVFKACKARVFNRRVVPDDFLNELINWCKQAPDEIFMKNENYDIYSHVFKELGPWGSLLHRKAVMLEVLRVLAGFESSWDWNEGRDTKNPNSNTSCTEEAGIFQCSGDSMNFDRSLRNLLKLVAGNTDCDTFRSVSKNNHAFAIEYCARLLRFTVNHHGPVRLREIHPWLKLEAVAEFERFLSNEG
jgi:N-acetyl-anhydromuramyl-L-alanine amidase AmpD